jgi:hypothetical protein
MGTCLSLGRLISSKLRCTLLVTASGQLARKPSIAATQSLIIPRVMDDNKR